MLDMGKDPEAALAAIPQISELLHGVVDRHRRTPQDDITTDLIDAEVDGERLTDEEIISFIRQMIAAGLDTTDRGTATLFWALLENPDQLRMVRDDPALIEGAVEEALRFAPPAGVAPRVATRDVDIAGTLIPAGAPVLLAFSAANYDETKWSEPLRFDITRKPNRHLTFGLGAHVCLGLNVARAEMRYALSAVVQRLPHIRKDPDSWPGTELHGWAFRSPTKLPAVWADPAHL
jgi:cytochrome P450